MTDRHTNTSTSRAASSQLKRFWKSLFSINLFRTQLSSSELAQSSQGSGDATQSAPIDSLGGGDVISPGGDAVSLGDGGEDLLGAECQLDDARVYHGLSFVHRSCLCDHLENKTNDSLTRLFYYVSKISKNRRSSLNQVKIPRFEFLRSNWLPPCLWDEKTK